MASLIVRNIDESVKANLRKRAAKHGRSTEAEVRSILIQATKEPDWLSEFVEVAKQTRGFVLPQRNLPRELNLFDDTEVSAS
ncbi:MAG: hypothetical protein LBC35_01175 [Coriobacteriales bacterium]|jgi:plasmid stability protein|nr:hypothetical protein [Coriobacteriales bacterium]